MRRDHLSNETNETEGVLAVILDWAGTSIDYGCQAPTKVFVDVFASLGIKLSLEEARGPMGLAKKDHVRKLFELPGIASQWERQSGRKPNEQDVDQLYLQLEPALANIAKDFCDPIPGAVAFVEELKDRGIKIGSTTGYVRKMMNGIVPKAEKLGFKPDAIVTSDDVEAGRPHPWMIRKNAKQLGVKAMERIVKIGDTVADVQEGLNANVWTIALTKSGNEVGLTERETKAVSASMLSEKINRAKEKLSAAGAHYIAEGLWECLPIIEVIGKRIQAGEKP